VLGSRILGGRALKSPLHANLNDFVFDNQMLAQAIWLDHVVAEVSCPTRYFAEASSIDLRRSLHYGLGCLRTAVEFRLARLGWIDSERLPRRVPATRGDADPT